MIMEGELGMKAKGRRICGTDKFPTIPSFSKGCNASGITKSTLQPRITDHRSEKIQCVHMEIT